MSNLTADLHMHTKYGTIWKRISMKYSFLKFICWLEHFGNWCETSEIRVVRGEPGANSTSLHA